METRVRLLKKKRILQGGVVPPSSNTTTFTYPPSSSVTYTRPLVPPILKDFLKENIRAVWNWANTKQGKEFDDAIDNLKEICTPEILEKISETDPDIYVVLKCREENVQQYEAETTYHLMADLIQTYTERQSFIRDLK